MVKGFGDIQAAIRMRESIAAVARAVVHEIHPPTRVGRVFSVNNTALTAQVLFPGETVDSLVTVHYAANMVPVNYMSLTFNTAGYDAGADIVRVAGTPGSYYITDFVTGYPDSLGYSAKRHPTVISRWTWYDAAPATQPITNTGLRNLVFMANNIPWPIAANLAEISFSFNCAAGANAGGSAVFRVTNAAGAWADRSSHRLHNHNTPALNMGFSMTQTFNASEARRSNGTVDVALDVSNDTGSGAPLYFTQSQLAVSFIGLP